MMTSATTEAQVKKVAARIAQMKAIATSTHSQEEAKTMLAQVMRLMIKHQLTDAAVAAATSEHNEDFDPLILDQTGDFNVIYQAGRSSPWKAELAWNLAKLHGCYCLKYRAYPHGSSYRVFGRKSDIEICKYVFETACGMISRLADWYTSPGKKRGINPEKESWCLGCANGFLVRMRTEKEALLETARRENPGAMVLVSNKSSEAKKALEQANPHMRVRSAGASKSQHSSSAYQSGFQTGSNLSVGKALPE